MKILVCIKQVPESEAAISPDEKTGWVRQEGHQSYRMNNPDLFAVEEAVMIKEALPDTVVDALTVGPERAFQVLERAMGMGADRGVHILAPEEAYLSPLTIANWIAAHALDKDYDLILAGVMAEDDMQGQVGPLAAELLSLPCATSVIFKEILPEKGTVFVEREIEGGQRDMLELDLPALLTIQTGINMPRYPSLSNLLRAKKQKALVIHPDRLPEPEDREKILRARYPLKSRAGKVLQGDPKEKA
ncbi:MAG: electron transfer flavoprotein subunit beta/FixA family protein, partial [Deltaproteobacteria bacterium]|nr:electron transfer flavoprotein subunit beta/FixA family protein [Deltaproteobacteria bacterium]